MTRAEVLQIMGLIKTYYPGNRLPDSQEEINHMVNVWSTVLDDVSFTQAFENLKDHVKTSPYPPAIADLCKVRAPKPPSAAETKMQLEQNHDMKRLQMQQDEETEQAMHEALAAIRKLKGKMEVGDDV